MNLKTFHFWRFSVEIPSDWEITSYGFEKKGAILIFGDVEKLDRLYVRWEEISGGWDLEKLARSLEKRLDKKNLSLERVRFGVINGHKSSLFKVNGDKLAIWRCRESKRAYMILYRGGTVSEFDGLLSRVKCHLGGELARWTMLDLYFETPLEFRPKELSLKLGKSIFTLQDEDSYILICRWHFASKISNIDSKASEALKSFSKLLGKKLIYDKEEKRSINNLDLKVKKYHYVLREKIYRRIFIPVELYIWESSLVDKLFVAVLSPGVKYANMFDIFQKSLRVIR